MPLYLFEHVKTGEVHEISLHMSEAKVYLGPAGKDKATTWRRVWTKPQMAVDSAVLDPYSASDFARVTNKPGLVGDLWERSKEMSHLRAEKDGTDNVKKAFYDKYSSKRKGGKHPQQKREEMVKKMNAAGVKVEYPD